MTVLGTRPEIIRLSLVIQMLDQSAEHVVVHTGQNYDERLDALFFHELGVRNPDVRLGIRADSSAGQIGQILGAIERVLLEQHPDRLLILGDTNSGLVAIIARRLGIPVYHMEAGNRCYDDRVPEEVNRRIIDHVSTVLLPYTNRSRENLLAEGIPGNRIYVTGNPIKEVMDAYAHRTAESSALTKFAISAGQYLLVTIHRAENVDREDKLREILDALAALHYEYQMPVICSLHPRTRAKAHKFGIDLKRTDIRFLEPLGFFDFLRLEQSAFCILSDSGTVQEEACIFGVPTVTLREVTERPETLECGSNFLAGSKVSAIQSAVRFSTAQKGHWKPPVEYLKDNVAETTCRIVLSYRPPDLAEREWQSESRL